tara:strand:- start:432 stop:605 length:174 start_codon:yes stop_codon:yes gene_type:complete
MFGIKQKSGFKDAAVPALFDKSKFGFPAPENCPQIVHQPVIAILAILSKMLERGALI